jgi:HlyD family secretion protein
MKRALLPLAALALAACDPADDGLLHGYVEGDFVLVAPEVSGVVAELRVADGARVEAGALLFRLDDARYQAEADRAAAAARAAAARFDDAAAGGREPEIKAARDMLAQATATAREADENLARIRSLFDRGVVARARLDTAEAAANSAAARVSELRERVTLAELPARENLLAALAAEAEAADAALAAARDALGDTRVAAPADGTVERVLRRPGETAGPAAPVVRFLPDGARIAVLFVPEPEISELALGDRLTVSCDGCSALPALVTAIDSEAEFTSPMIYSDKERARLVFRIEARFTDGAPPPGTPIRAEASG